MGGLAPLRLLPGFHGPETGCELGRAGLQVADKGILFEGQDRVWGEKRLWSGSFCEGTEKRGLMAVDSFA